METLEISIHAPPRGATFWQDHDNVLDDYFNSRPSARGDASTLQNRSTLPTFQFTPLREGRRAVSSCIFSILFISIHAPPRGATLSAPATGPAGFISIHAPPRGATATRRGAFRPVPHFNSRPSARGDFVGKVLTGVQSVISIHAPPRGATGDVEYVNYWQIIFQFTPLREGRQIARGKVLAYQISIHAPPRGATLLFRARSPS